MKKTILAIAIIISMIGCKKDEDVEEPKNVKIMIVSVRDCEIYGIPDTSDTTYVDFYGTDSEIRAYINSLNSVTTDGEGVYLCTTTTTASL
jgi:N-methylhydantoinase B/oxoprolinase/acetone carboxylase alpha subunit